MAEDDFNVESLAEYLHVQPQQVARLAERGQLPCRKVGGQWRFPQAEIHHWLEDRIGLSGEEELATMEGFLRKPTAEDTEPHASIAEMLPVEAIAVPLAARTRSSVIAEMTQLAARTGWLWDPERMADAVREREAMSTTALDNGVALLHPRRPMPSILGQAFLALGRTDKALPFSGGRGALTDIFFLICSVDDRGHLRTLARLSRLLSSDDVLANLRAAPDASTVQQIIASAEENLA